MVRCIKFEVDNIFFEVKQKYNMKNQQDSSVMNKQQSNNNNATTSNGGGPDNPGTRTGTGGGAPALGVGAGARNQNTGRTTGQQIVSSQQATDRGTGQQLLQQPATGVANPGANSGSKAQPQNASDAGPRPDSGSGKASKIHTNFGINGIKPQIADIARGGGKQQQLNGGAAGAKNSNLLGSHFPLPTQDDASPSKHLLGGNGQANNTSFENTTQLFGSSKPPPAMKSNQNLDGGKNSINNSNVPTNRVSANNLQFNNGVARQPFNSNLLPPQDAMPSYEPLPKGSSQNVRQGKVAPLPIEFAEQQRMGNSQYGVSFGGGANNLSIDGGRQFLNGTTGKGYASDEFFGHEGDRDINGFNGGYSTRKVPQSLRSSFDYIDVNMNEAMKVAGEPTLTGRASRFFRKNFKEDHWSGDESVFNKQMKMPNVNLKKQEYQKDIGLNLDTPTEAQNTQSKQTEERVDTLKEARDMLPPAPFYKIVKKDRIQIIDDYYDRCPMLEFRKQLMRARVYINRSAQLVVMHPLFETISITVIVVNSMFLAMDDPLRDPSETPYFMSLADDIFQYAYTIEMVFKILSLGFILNSGSYLRDAWNILDFVIIASGYMGMFLSGSGANLSVLRSFRVIRPLRTISSVQGLRIIVASLINAIPLLRDSILVLLFFFLIFAIAGCQLFTGALKNRCFNIDTGVVDPLATYCGGGNSCRPGYYCGKSNENPSNGATNFDNVMFSLMQVFQVVTLEGWTSIMVALMQSVGTWIFIYFYPIVFIGAFFLLNLTLAVIKAKFTEEMNNKKEAAGPPKKKKLDDAAESSEDEDARARELQDKIDHIKVSKQMSPRSKENLINKIKIEHMLWKLDTAFDKRDVEHKIVERTEEDELIAKKSKFISAKHTPNGKSYYSSAIDKIGILQPQQKAISFAVPKATTGKTKVAPLNYSDVFYSNKNTVIQANRSPRENLRDIFNGTSHQQSTLTKPGRNIGSPIREDDEEQDRTGLLEAEEDMRRGRRRQRPSSGGRNNYSDIDLEGPLSNTQQPSRLNNVSKWLGRVFEAKREDGNGQGEQKKLVFAGIKNNNVRPGLSMIPQRQTSLRRNPQEYDERMKRAVYENITRNFDIFEFLDDNNEIRAGASQNNAHLPNDGDDEMSDELEFEIDDDANRLESLYFETDQAQRRERNTNRGTTGPILDLEDGDEDIGTAQSGEAQIKRGSTQATAAEGKAAKQNSTNLDVEQRYTSPFMQSVVRQVSLSPREKSTRELKMRAKLRRAKEPDLVFKGKENGILRLFRACRKMKAKTGHNFKEEYLLLKKRARSIGPQREEVQEPGGEFSARGRSMMMQKRPEGYSTVFDNKDLDEKNMTVRAKSIENKRRRLLAESIRFQRRIEIMRKRRAQFFAPAIKTIGVNRDDLVKEYDDYVLRKRHLKLDEDMIDQVFTKKKSLYRSASTEALIRQRDVIAFEMQQPLKNHKKVKDNIDIRSLKSKEGSVQLDSQRSQYLDNEFEEIVDKFNRKEEELRRFKHYEEVPDMEKVLYDKKLKIVVKMTNHQYTSINDIFEKSGPGRFMSDREKALLIKDQKKREALKMQLPKRIPPRDLIIGYQKKIFVQAKQFHEELLRNEFDPSDEDQDGMMDRIEGEYNYDHRSHIFVTGTVSVVVNKPHADNKIMNANYHANIHAMQLIKEQEEAERQQALLEEQQALESGTNRSQRQASKTKIVVLNENGNHATQSLQVNAGRNHSLMGGGGQGVEGSAWQRINKMNFSANASGGFSMMRMMKNASRYSMSIKKGRAGSVGDSISANANNKQQPPKPEPLTDKQILKRLNEEVQKSRIFRMLNIKRLPDKIIRRQEVDKNLFKKKKKKGGGDKPEDSLGDDEGSAIEEIDGPTTKKAKKIDYFLDRNIDGNFHISLAKNAAFRRHKDLVEWSGQDIMARFDPYKARLAVSRLNSIRVWPYGLHGFIKKRRVLLKAFMNSQVVEHSMTLCVLGNTVVLSLDYYGADQEVQAFCKQANTFFTLVFACEMGLRIIAIGPAKWLADKMNYMDGTIVLLSLVELIFMSGSGALSALRSVRIFRVFRVLRVARLLRGLKSMVQIINVISRSISSFIYLAMLLMLFIFIYALLGMQVFGGNIIDPEVKGTVRYNFDSFNNSFITSFILLTTENWNQVMFYAYSGDVNQFLIAIYFVSCIFIGNWMLLNLFLAILLDSFTAVEEEDMMTPEKKEAIKQKMLEDLKLKEGEDFIEGMEEIQKEGFVLKSDKPKKKRKKRKDEPKKKQEPPAPMNILEESQEVDLQELARRDQEALELRKQLFRGIECERSCYVLPKSNWLRILCYKIIHHQKFETFIMVLIVGSSFKLVFDTYTTKLPDDDPMVFYSGQFDLIFQVFFTLEMVIKIIAFGFVMDENSYLTEAWNKLDCFIVTSGLIDTAMTGIDIPVIKILRLLRILRPLRFVSHSSSMKTLIEALMASMGSIFNVGVVIVIVFMMFAILGVNLFAGKLQSCSVDYYKINNQLECFKARGDWTTYDQNMDNVIKAMMTLFVVSNNEGWPDVMYYYCDATGVETGPKPGAGILNAYFFIFFVFVGSFFFMNLFVGVLFLNFEKAQRDEKEAMLLDGDEIKWVDMMKMICNEKPEIIKIPKNPISRWCYEVVKDESNFANFIMACIILNIFTMAAIFEGMSDSYSSVLEKINYFFTGAFTAECVLKLMANGGAYFNSAWNKFDFFVVSASFLDILMANMSANSLKVIRVGPQLARIMRVMRVSRLFKLLNKYKGLQALIQTITFSMPSVINAFALLALVYFIFSVLAVFFFKDIISGNMLDPDYMNFSNFTMALMMMLRLSTGEDWPSVMYDCMNTDPTCIQGWNCGTPYAPFFYLMFVLIQQYIMVNLFILIILQQFDLYYLPDDNVLDRFKADVTNFKVVWRRYSADFEGFKIRGNDVQKFFKDLKGDLGMSNEKDQRAIERNLVIMNIQADDDGFIYFNELLYKTMKRRYAPGRTKKKILFEVELETLDKLEKISKQQIFQSRKKERQKAVAVNPFLAMMYKNMSFNVWRDIYQQNLEKRQQHIALGLEREISDEEEDEEEATQYAYQTEEDEIIDELDKGYLEHREMQEARKADPGPDHDEAIKNTAIKRSNQLKHEVIEQQIQGKQ